MTEYPRYIGRELSWLQFNERVLEEAVDENNPILEQLRFLAIFSSNLDEYFMIRVAGMKGQVDLQLNIPDKKTGYYAPEYLNKMVKKSQRLIKLQYNIYEDKISELGKSIHLLKYDRLRTNQKQKVDNYYKNLVFPILTPIRFSSHLPFPLLPNLSIYLITKLQDELGKIHYSVVTVPKNIERVVHIKKNNYILLEDIIMHNMDSLYEGFNVLEVVPFRVTRDFDIEFDDQSDDFAKTVEVELKNRKRGAAIRLEISDQVSPEIIKFLQKSLPIQKKLIFYIDGPIDLTFLHELISTVQKKLPTGLFPSIKPIQPISFQSTQTIFDIIKKKDILLFHPHHSYEPVLRFLKEACEDKNVVAIKQTIYRTSKDSNIMKYLVKAAESGKQVTVLFELRARFDEENNLFWGTQLERSGAHVIYGVPNLKTHSKLLLIIRRTGNQLDRFVHFGTGNYNENNAKIYTDASYFTAKKTMGEDATKFFNYISSFTRKPKYQKLIASPFDIRTEFINLIDQEIKNQKEFGNGHVILKMNGITNAPIIEKLYDASKQGVKIDLICRGICCLNPGVEGLSENIHVRSIVGRYLEHMRVYYFYSNGQESTFISSADLMSRNMENRIELALNVTDRISKNKLIRLLKLQLKDNTKARENIQGKYEYARNDNSLVNAQLDLYKAIK